METMGTCEWNHICWRMGYSNIDGQQALANGGRLKGKSKVTIMEAFTAIVLGNGSVVVSRYKSRFKNYLNKYAALEEWIEVCYSSVTYIGILSPCLLSRLIIYHTHIYLPR